ncbi:hypothetical protein [Prochlorococcus sp. MIT 1307]|uniref:hypothetical protein n=1 Tax=Prochlorococcus sp. MIT 1307 TaxID=3096219 RepID=UPI002A75B6CC|nr:hypothetical protein [Prochlorococcus sp. MIT 1307]
MGDSYSDPHQKNRSYEGNRDDSRAGFRGGRGPGSRSQGGREGGGFRIRLSDNEMRAARALQEAFNLRSTVAVLGFAIRTLAQMLEEGKLDELVTQTRSQMSNAGNRREDGRQGSRRRFDGEEQNFNRGVPKPNPFARPEKPQPAVQDNGHEEDSSQQIADEGTVSDEVEKTSSIEQASESDKKEAGLNDSSEEEAQTNQESIQ